MPLTAHCRRTLPVCLALAQGELLCHGSVHQAPRRPGNRHCPLGLHHPLLLHRQPSAGTGTVPELRQSHLGLQPVAGAGAGPQVRHLPRRVGAGPELAAVHQRDVPPHPGQPELLALRPAGLGFPQVALEAGRLRPPAVRPAQVPPGRRQQDARLRWRLAGQEPLPVSPLPLVQGSVAQGRGGEVLGPEQGHLLRGLQLHHLHLLDAVPGEDGQGPRLRNLQAVPRRGRRQVALRGAPFRLPAHLGGQLVRDAGLPVRAPAARRRGVRRAQLHQQPHQLLPPPDGVPDVSPRAQRRRLQGHGDHADAVAVLALGGRRVGRRRGLQPHAAAREGRRGAGRGHGARVLQGAAGGVQGGGEGGRRQGRGDAAHGLHAGDADAARRSPRTVRALATREAARQRLRPLVPAGTRRRLERHAALHALELINTSCLCA